LSRAPPGQARRLPYLCPAKFIASAPGLGEVSRLSIPEATLAGTRRSLLTRLKNWDDQQGWQRFFDTYWKLLYSVARHMGLNESDAEDVVQETILMVAKQMPDFRYDPQLGSFKSWLMLIARRRVFAHLRKRGRQPKGGIGDTARTGRTAATNVSLIPMPASSTSSGTRNGGETSSTRPWPA